MWQLDNDENLHEYIKEKMGFIQGDVQLTDGKAEGRAQVHTVHVCTSPDQSNGAHLLRCPIQSLKVHKKLNNVDNVVSSWACDRCYDLKD